MWESMRTYNMELDITSNVVDLSNYPIDAVLNVFNISDYQLIMFSYNTNSKKLTLNGYVQPIKINIYYLSEQMLRKEKLERILK